MSRKESCLKNAGEHIVSFRLGEQRFGLDLAAVEKVYPLMEITPLPNAPEIILGVVNLRGNIVAVIDIRSRFRLPAREHALTDRLLFARTSKRPVSLIADVVDGIMEIVPDQVVPGRSILPKTPYIEGVVKLADGMIFIHDLDTFLSLEEDKKLDAALRGAM